MDQVIIYPNENGGVVLCYPADCGLSVQEIARKDVPERLPYLIVSAASIPEDHLFAGAYEADFSRPDGFGIGADAWFAEQDAKQ